jgi:hypothetical protein
MPLVTYSTQPCQVCGLRSSFTLDADRVDRWMKGGLIQNVFPEMSAAERETMISGTHDRCWEKLMGGGD